MTTFHASLDALPVPNILTVRPPLPVVIYPDLRPKHRATFVSWNSVRKEGFTFIRDQIPGRHRAEGVAR